MLEFLKKNIFIIFLSSITLFIGFLTFLTFIDRSFIELNQNNLQFLLITNIILLLLLFIFIFLEIKNSIKIIKGGKERSDSSLIAIKYLKKYKPKNVFIHDAARPNFSIKLLKNLSKNLKKNKAVIPVVTSKDSIKIYLNNYIIIKIKRL